MPDVLGTVGRYELVRELGRGPTGRVYVARRPDLDGLVALKELDALGAADPAAGRRFVRSAGSLTHPNIATVYDVFEHGGTSFVATELLERGSLRPYLAGLSLAQAAGVLEGVLAALAHAEERGVMHGELVPESVMVTDDGRVKIADLGIPRPSSPVPPAGSDLRAAGAIAAGVFAGTERAGGARLDPGLGAWAERMRRTGGASFESAAEAWDELEDIVFALLGPRWRREARLGEPASARTAPEWAGVERDAGAAARGPRFVPERARGIEPAAPVERTASPPRAVDRAVAAP